MGLKVFGRKCNISENITHCVISTSRFDGSWSLISTCTYWETNQFSGTKLLRFNFKKVTNTKQALWSCPRCHGSALARCSWFHLNSFKHSLEQAPTIFIKFHYSLWRAIWKSLQAIWRIGRFQRFSKCQRHLRSSAATLSASLIDLSPS